jgi:hypothetical protein
MKVLYSPFAINRYIHSFYLKPLLSDLNSPMPLRIIPTEEKSRPPVYSPELAALLTSAHSRKTKLLDKSSLITPPTLPKRADRLSAEARLLGRLSKRREVKIRWRYFTTEWKKVLPPLQVAVREKSRSKELCRETSEIRAVTRAGIRNIGMQGSGVLEDVQSLVGLPWTDRIPTRREIRARDQNINLLSVPRQPMTRWLRRRYQELLGRLPILVYSYFEQEGDHTFGKFEVSQHPSAITPSKRHNITRLAEVDDVGLTWIQQVDKKNKGTRL